MIIVSLKQHFPARFPEWWASALLILWGVYVVLHPAIFTHPASAQMFRSMATMAGEFPPAALWGLSAVVIGMTRACALFINGAYTRTPLIRVLMSMLSTFIWTQVCLGLIKSGVDNTGIIVYGGLVVLDIVSAYRAATDMVYAEVARHGLKQQGSRRHVRSSNVV